ncbi:MAG TPA: hypothetical protein PKE27_22470 [Povalibacter sp.]|uniref:hypothetical protein n=1 Tax=Povalibacter sp. TaxID=1962978 RepID=UPI002C2C7B5F|nr:hypothetical protein [Povalibacter sp.]HMN47357.1 hypothetical protein [Povalibacter sp.]
MTEHPPRIVSVDSPQQVAQALRSQQRSIVVFAGYSGMGYEDEAAMRAQVQAVLAKFDPRRTTVSSGATAAGIGAVYELAKRLGFTTVGIVSSLAQNENEPLANDVDQVFHVKDDQWGGYLPGTTTLSPTSQAIVSSGDVFIGIGGGNAARDELLEAKRLNKPVTFIPADMNHRVAREKAAAKGEPAPTDFRGAAHLALHQALND